MTLPNLIIHVDGSSRDNPGAGGFGIVIHDPVRRCAKHIAGNRPDATNNQMELLAAIIALSRLKTRARLRLISDSRYLVDGFNQYLPDWKAANWRTSRRKPVANAAMWRHFDRLAGQHEISVEWVEGHSGDPANEAAHDLAFQAATRLQTAGELSPRKGWARLVQS